MNNNPSPRLRTINKVHLKIIYFLLTILLLTLYTKPLIPKFGLRTSIHITFLSWSFLVLCFPLARGKILIKIPYELIFKSKLAIPELVAWPLAIIGNFIMYYRSPASYLKTYVTTLFFNILTNPWPFWIMIIVCAIATFYTAFLRVSTKKHRAKYKTFGVLLVLISITVTILLSFSEFVIVFNAHGNI